MKTAFYLLLLANITLLMYEYHHGAFDRDAGISAPDASLIREPIRLASEVNGEKAETAAQTAPVPPPQSVPAAIEAAAPAVPEASVPAAAGEAVGASLCYEAGPFASDQAINDWSRAVQDAKGLMKPSQRNEKEIIAYLVLYPTSGSRDDQKAAMETLREHGVSDAFPLGSGDYKGSISLGSFLRENRAVIMQKALRAKGVESEVKPRFREGKQRYAFVSGPEGLADTLEGLKKKYSQIQLKTLPGADPNCASEANPFVTPVAPAPPEAAGSPVQAAAETPEPHRQEPALPETPQTRGEPAKTETPALETATAPSAPKGPSDEAKEEPAKRVCYEAGPFADSQTLSAWQKQVVKGQGQVKSLLREGKSVGDYLVVYAPSAGEDSKAVMQMLRERGLKDPWILPSGDEKGRISLGVFDRETSALDMKRGLLEKGVESIVTPRYRTKRLRYALITGPEALAADLDELEKTHPDIALRRLGASEPGCQAAANAGN